MNFQIASSFGNAYADLDEAGRAQAWEGLDRGLDRHRLGDGTIQLR